MDQAFLAGQHFYEGAEIHDARNLADVRFAYFDVLRQRFNPFLRLFAADSVDRGDVYEARIFDVDFSARFFRNLLDYFAARPDDVANLIGIDLHGNDARRIRRQLLPRFADDLEHLAHDVDAAFVSLLQSLGQDFAAEAFDLNIHLDSRNALHRTGDLEVHIAESVFHALNIRQNREVVALRNQAHSHAGYGSFDGNAGIHERQGTAAYAAHGAGAVRFEDFRHDADCVGEIFFLRQYLYQRPFSQLAVADFAASRSAGRFRFADAEGREIIVMHIAAVRFKAYAVDMLGFGERSQGGEAHDLCLAAGKEARAVSALEQADFAADGAHFVDAAAVGTNLVDGDHMTDDFLNHLLSYFRNDVAVFRVDVREVFVNITFDGVHLFFPFHLVSRENSGFHGFFAIGVDGFDDIGRRFFFYEFLLRNADFVEEAELEFNDLLDFFMSEHDGVKDVFFRNLLSAAFNHEDSVFRAGDDDIHVALFALSYGRVNDILPVYAAHADAGNRAGKGNMGHAQRYGRADHGGDFRGVIVVYAEIVGDDVHVVTIGLREQRPNGTVDEAGKERRRFRRLAFPFNKAAGNLPDRIHFFFIIDSEREKICVFARFLRARRRNEYSRVAVAYQCGAAGLLRQFADFDNQRAAGKIHLEFLFFHSCTSFIIPAGDRH